MGEHTVTYIIAGVQPDDVMVVLACVSENVAVRNRADEMEGVCSYPPSQLAQGSWQCR